jgi:transcriptional regulator with XRE-family HTH domain
MNVPASVVLADGDFGSVLRAWRAARGLSQLALSVRTGVSSRHLSYLETGRSAPSRDMVLTLAVALDVPLRDRNAMLQAAGFASLYRETPLEAPAMGHVRDAIRLLLGATEPSPTFVVNRRYDVLDANATGHWLLATFVHDLGRFPRPWNMASLLASPAGLRPSVTNWEEVARKVFGRLQREVGGAHVRDAVDEALMKEVGPLLAALGPAASPPETLPILVGLNLRREAVALRLFTTIATLGTPLDVTLQELRIETLFPADAESRSFLSTRTP